MTILSQSTKTKAIKKEVRKIRAMARKITASKARSLSYLEATGMYTASGQIKPEFR